MKVDLSIKKSSFVLLILFMISWQVYPQGATVTKLGEWNSGDMMDVAAAGNYVYCAAGAGGLYILDVSTPGSPKKTGSILIPEARRVTLSGSYAYVIESYDKLHIVDISDPSSPSVTGTYQNGDKIRAVAIAGNYAFVGCGYIYKGYYDGKLIILDISNPAAPVETGEIRDKEDIADIAVSGSYAYTCSYTWNMAGGQLGELQVFDISDVYSPAKISSLDTGGGAYRLFVRGNYVYMADGSTGLHVIDISDPHSPTLTGNIDTIESYGVFVDGNYAYNVGRGLDIIDISNPANPVLTGQYKNDTITSTVSVYVKGNYAFLAAYSDGMLVMDVSKPASPSLTGEYDPSSRPSLVEVSGNYAYLGSVEGLHIIDIADNSSPQFVSSYELGYLTSLQGMEIKGNYLYLATNKGLEVIDISNPLSPLQAAFVSLNYGAIAIAIDGNYAYLVSGWNLLDSTYYFLVIDISSPTTPSLLKSIEIDHSAYELFISGNYAYAVHYGGMAIIDIANPSAPSFAGFYTEQTYIRSVCGSGNWLYLAVRNPGANGLTVLDIANPTSPRLTGKVVTAGYVQLALSGNFVYAAAGDSGLHVIDVSNPSAPKKAGSYETGGNNHEGSLYGVDISGDKIYGAERDLGNLYIFSVSFYSQLFLDKTQFNFVGILGDDEPQPQTLSISNSGVGTINWTVATDQSWLSCTPSVGTDAGQVSVSIDTAGLTPGKYTGNITVSAPGAQDSPQTAAVTFTYYDPQQLTGPFGEFATPIDGSTVRSSIAVTGWALDDIGLESVKIFRQAGKELVYIGDAVFVEGARPDVQAAYPGYPDNHKAGWGYMLLTNFLPGGGNGTFILHAVAQDVEGNRTTLGTKTILCDNDNAVKPFGAIDTPEQGGLASGSYYVNFGWALTPMPNAIPTDGSSIDVWVDGVKLGHPTYNQYRSDIAELFPGYANSDGAVGYFYLDTTHYTNGVHTIQWTVTDDAGNTDGVGSRYFTIQNSGREQARHSAAAPQYRDMVQDMMMENPEPVTVKKGYGDDSTLRLVRPNHKGNIHIQLTELQRLEIRFEPGTVNVSSLPIGSALNPETGTFTWAVGPAFLGPHRLVFGVKRRDGRFYKTTVWVNIIAKTE
jgi:hypothetical protein